MIKAIEEMGFEVKETRLEDRGEKKEEYRFKIIESDILKGEHYLFYDSLKGKYYFTDSSVRNSQKSIFTAKEVGNFPKPIKSLINYGFLIEEIVEEE